MSREDRRRERDEKRRKKERERRKRHYEREKKKREKLKANGQGKNQPEKKSSIDQAVDFLASAISLFLPSKSRTDHHRLVKQGAVFAICIGLMGTGFGISYHGHLKKIAIANAVQSFTTSELQFSKTQTSVSTKVKPFMTQDRKTVYIPFRIEDMTNMEPDASKYHILFYTQNGKPFTYHPDLIQLYSYGSTGQMFLVVHSADKIQSQVAEIVLWTGENLGNSDNADPDDDDATDAGLAKLKSKYDTLSFSINLGALSVARIPKNKTIHIKKTIYVKEKGKKKKVPKVVTVPKVVPIKANANLYNKNRFAYIYNRVYAEKKLENVKRKINSRYKHMSVDINKINRDYNALAKAGYKLPKLPAWATTNANNLSNGLPFTIEQINDLNFLDDPFMNKDQTTKVSIAAHKQEIAQSGDTSQNEETKEEKYMTKLNNMVIKDRQGDTLDNTAAAGGGQGTSNSSGSQTASNQWTDLLDSMQNIYNAKKYVYNTKILTIWNMHTHFNTNASFGSEQNNLGNTGAITNSHTKGSNRHGRYMTIANVNKDN